VTSKLSHVAQPPVSSSSIIISVPSISVTLFQLSFPYASTDTMFVKSSSTLLCLQVYVCDFQTFNSFKLISQSSVISSLIVKFIKSSFQIFVIVILNIASSDFFTFWLSFQTTLSKSSGLASTLSIFIADGIVEGSINTTVSS
jgi:hypothetical protein